MSREIIDPRLFKASPRPTMTAWLESHGNEQSFHKSCVASVLSHLMLYNYTHRHGGLPTENTRLLQTIVELKLYADIVDRETHYTCPLRLMAWISAHGDFNVFIPEKVEDKLRDQLKALESKGVSTTPFVPPKEGECYVKLEDNHATLMYQDSDSLRCFDTGTKSPTHKGELCVEDIETFDGIAIDIRFNPATADAYVDSAYAEFMKDGRNYIISHIERTYTHTELAKAYYAKKLLATFQPTSPEAISYIVSCYFANNTHLEALHGKMLTIESTDGISILEQLNTLSIDLPTLRKNSKHPEIVLVMQFVNPTETRRMIAEELSQPIEGRTNSHVKTCCLWLNHLTDDYNDIKDRIKHHLLSAEVLHQACDKFKTIKLLGQFTNDEHTPLFVDSLTRSVSASHVTTYFQSISDVFIFLKLTRKYSLPHLVEPAIDIITTSEPMRTNFFGKHSEYTDYYFRAITHLLNDSHPALAARVTDTYHSYTSEIRPPSPV